MLPNGGRQKFFMHVEMAIKKSADGPIRSHHAALWQENSRLDAPLSATRPLPILAPSDDPPPEHVPGTVQRLRDRLLRTRPRTGARRRVLRRQLHGARKLPPRKRPRRVAQKRRVVHARRQRRQRERERRHLDPRRHVLVVRVRRPRRRPRCLGLGWGRGRGGGEAAQGGDVGPAAPCYERGGHAGGRERGCGEGGACGGREARLDYEDEGREGAR